MDPPFEKKKNNRWKGVSVEWMGGKDSLDFRLTAQSHLLF